MREVDALLEETREALRPLEEKILRHPYILALENGEIPNEQLQTFAGEQYHIVSSDLSSISYLLARASTETTRDFFWFVIQGEVAALELLGGFAGHLGMDTERMMNYLPMPAAQAYKNYVAWLSLQGRPSEVATAFLVNFPAWGENCGRMSGALRSRYGLPPEAVKFFDLFATPAPEFGEKARAVIANGLAAGDHPEMIKTTARYLQEYELMFWDAVYDAASGKPGPVVD